MKKYKLESKDHHHHNIRLENTQLYNVKFTHSRNLRVLETVDSIKNIHLYIFRNLNFVFSVLIC